MVRGISAVDSIYGKTKATLNHAAKKSAQFVKDNRFEITAMTTVTTALGLYGACIYGLLRRADEPTIKVYHAKPSMFQDPDFFKKLGDKIKEKFSIDISKAPKGIDPSEPYMVDKAGNYMMDEYGVIPNPWYNPDLIKEGAEAIPSAVNVIGMQEVSMDSFLSHAAAAHTDAAAAASDLSFVGEGVDAPDDVIDDNLIQTIGSGIKNIIAMIADNV